VELLALAIPIAVFVTVRHYAEKRRTAPLPGNPSRNHSPGWGVIAWRWLLSHIRRDPDPEPDPLTPTLTQEFDWGAVDYTESATKRQVVGKAPEPPRPVVPPARPRPPMPEPTRLEVWVAASLQNGARYRDILSEGMRTFGVSESTVKRAIRKAKKENT